MSERFPGGIISKTAPVPTGPYENGTAPGIWTLEQQAEFVRQGIWPIAGNAPPYIEDVFSTWLYTGNGSTQTINNGIDLAGKGGLVWTKNRLVSGGWGINLLIDTARGLSGSSSSGYISSNNANGASGGVTPDFSSFNSNGYSLGAPFGLGAAALNGSGNSFVSWTFREQPKFFDVVTWSGNGTGNRAISHALGSVPGCIIVKNTATSGTDWMVYHRGTSNPNFNYTRLNLTDATATSGSNVWDVTSTTFQAASLLDLNNNGNTYVAYLFAHNAGGFGLTGTDNVISCGSYTGTGSAQTLSLGYEPQWVLIKQSSGANAWNIWDNMRGMVVGGTDAYLQPNTSNAEDSLGAYDFLSPTATGLIIDPTSNGYNYVNTNGATYIYIAIRRGPMKTPTTGTSVFAVNSLNTPPFPSWVSGFPVDMAIMRYNANTTDDPQVATRLLQQTQLLTSSTAAETSNSLHTFDYNNGWGSRSGVVSNWYSWMYRRAPGYFDVVCYTGTGSSTTQAHNLAVVPELMIVKRRNGVWDWMVYTATDGPSYYYWLNSTSARRGAGADIWNSTTPTSSVFSLGNSDSVNASGSTYVNYLFASCPGVSKVGTFTGTGATQVINCGFTGGARFVLIKATSTTGNWMLWDTFRGMIPANDPYLTLNSTAAEVTNTDWVDTAASGFELSNAGGNLANSNGVSYIFLAIS